MIYPNIYFKTGKYASPLAILVAMACQVGAGANAADIGAEELIRQQQRQMVQRQQQLEQSRQNIGVLPSSVENTMPDALPSGPQPCFPITSVVLEGELTDYFEPLFRQSFRLDPATGSTDFFSSCVNAGAINQLMRRFQNRLIDAGYITTRVVAAQQDLKSGTLRLTLIPGRIDKMRLTQTGALRTRLDSALPYRQHQLLNLRDIEQALENLKRVPTVDADIKIAPAQPRSSEDTPGFSDLAVTWQQAGPFRFQAGLDDAGSRATGKLQGSATLSLDNPLGLNDLFYIGLNTNLRRTGSFESRGNNLYYAIPSGYWLWNLSGSQSDYLQQVQGIGDMVNQYRGDSRNVEVGLSRIVQRDSRGKTTLGLQGWARRSHNYINDTEVEVQRRRLGGFGITLNRQQQAGPVSIEGNLSYRRGTGAWQALPAPEELFNEGTSRMQILTGSLQISQPFEWRGSQWRYSSGIRGQWNYTPLIAQDQFSIGGRYTVRGFDGENTLLAERGLIVRNDLGRSLGSSGAEAYLGIDYGRVGGPATANLLGNQLIGSALGIRGAWRQISYDLFVGRPVKKPDGFNADSVTGGVSIIWSYSPKITAGVMPSPNAALSGTAAPSSMTP